MHTVRMDGDSGDNEGDRPRLSGTIAWIWTGRILQFFAGLLLCSIAIWISIRAGLGVAPWDVLHGGISDRTGLSFGTTVIVVGIIVVLISALLRVRLGIGTIINAFVVGVIIDTLLATSWLNSLQAEPLALRVFSVVGGVIVLGLGVALYIGAGFGAGPRDSLMVGFHQRGMSLGWSRLVIEASVLLLGWLLGGPVGLGTVLLALGTGPAVQAAFMILRQAPHRP